MAEFVERWQPEVLSQSEPSTIRAAKSHLRRHTQPILGELRLEQIGAEVQQMFISQLSGRLSRKTLLNVTGTLSAILSKAKEWRCVCETVNFQSPALPAGNGGQQARAIITAAEQLWKMLFTLAAMTRTHAGELLGLQLGDLDFQTRIIHIRRSAWYGKAQTPKTATSLRTIPMPEALA